MLQLNFSIVCCNPTEKLTLSLVTESVSAINAVFQQLRHDAVDRLEQGLERAYSTVLVPYPVALTGVFGVAVTIVRWKGEGSGDDGELEPAEGRLTET